MRRSCPNYSTWLNRLHPKVRIMFGMLREAVWMTRRIEIKLFLTPVVAGYPSPAQDYTDGPLDLNEHLIANPAATFFVRASGSLGLERCRRNKRAGVRRERLKGSEKGAAGDAARRFLVERGLRFPFSCLAAWS